MQEEQPLDPPERELAEALGRLEPESVGCSPRQIWYEAGVLAGRRRAGAWRWATATVTVAAGVVVVWVLARPPAAVERVTYVRESGEPSVPAAVAAAGQDRPTESPAAYLQIRDALLREGLGGLPPAPGGGGGAAAPDAWGPGGNPLAPNRWYLNEEG